MFRQTLVQVVAALVDHAVLVDDNDIVVRHADALDQLQNRQSRGAGPHQADFQVAELAAGNIAGVQKRRRRDDRRAVLVVMEDRNIQLFTKLALDLETLGRADILKIDAAERVAEPGHAFHEAVHVLVGDLEIDGIDVGEALEQHRLAFHHRL